MGAISFREFLWERADFTPWLVEIADVASMDTSGLDLRSSGSFDVYQAEQECESEIGDDFRREHPRPDVSDVQAMEIWRFHRRNYLRAKIADCLEKKRQSWTPQHFSHSWEMDGDRYYASFSRYSYDTDIGRVNNIWSITLEGPAGYSTTNKGNPARVYTQLLLAIKKLMETQQVDGFSFTPAEDAMGLVYDQFVRRFLKDFVRISSSVIVRKEIYDRALAGMSASERRRVEEKIAREVGQYQDHLKYVKQQKGRVRQERSEWDAKRGQMVSYRGEAAIILGSELSGGYISVKILYWDERDKALRTITTLPSYLDDIRRASSASIQNFLLNALGSDSTAGLDIRSLMRQHGVYPPGEGPAVGGVSPVVPGQEGL